MQQFFGITVGSAVAIIAYVSKVFGPIESIGMEIQNVQTAIAGIRRIDEFLEEKEASFPEEAYPEGIEVKVEKQTQISVTGASRELVGQVAAKIRGFRPPEPYLGKGVKYSDEKLRRKEGKSAGK